jgi:hypothetical protein
MEDNIDDNVDDIGILSSGSDEPFAIENHH